MASTRNCSTSATASEPEGITRAVPVLLRNPAAEGVQLANFGRELDGSAESLPGHRQTMLLITDAEVIAVSGSDRHPIVAPSPDPEDAFEGTVFSLSDAELSAADEYEVDGYARMLVRLSSGLAAWVYFSRAGLDGSTA